MDQGTASKWEARIQALLRKAESTRSDHEREALLEKANELIVKWGIDRAVLEAKAMSEGAPAKIIKRTFTLDGLRGRTREDMLIVYSWLRSGLGSMRGVYTYGYDSKGDKLVKIFNVIGFESDLEAFAMLAASINVQLISGAAAWWKNEVMMDQGCRGFPAHVRSAKKSAYMMGFAERVYLRLEEIRRRAETDANTGPGRGTDLVLVDRKTRVDQFFDNMYPDLKKPKPLKRRYDEQGFTAGYRDGARADIGQKRFNGARGEVTS